MCAASIYLSYCTRGLNKRNANRQASGEHGAKELRTGESPTVESGILLIELNHSSSIVDALETSRGSAMDRLMKTSQVRVKNTTRKNLSCRLVSVTRRDILALNGKISSGTEHLGNAEVLDHWAVQKDLIRG